MPPRTGSAAPVTLLRPAETVTGTALAWAMRITACTWSTVDTRTITPRGVAGLPPVSVIIEPAHQSRVHVTTSPVLVRTASATWRSAASVASLSGTASRCRPGASGVSVMVAA
ncbi:hypothetical protein D3C86_1419980 [compost metagenome]